MFNWLKKDQTTSPAIEPEFSLSTLSGAEIAVLFKHSPTCAISWAARSEVDSFAAANPNIPVHTLSVRNRALSRQIAAEINVRHESPQVIIFRHGQVVAHTSHEGVTAEYLQDVTARPILS